MKITTITKNNKKIAIVKSEKAVITDVQSALDVMATVNYQHDSSRIILDKASIGEAFFDLKTNIAGEILQKFVNYCVKIAIIGDFSVYTSKSLRDFIYESNKGANIFFLDNETEAIEKLGAY